jgi:hypothetical protein
MDEREERLQVALHVVTIWVVDVIWHLLVTAVLGFVLLLATLAHAPQLAGIDASGGWITTDSLVSFGTLLFVVGAAWGMALVFVWTRGWRHG